MGYERRKALAKALIDDGREHREVADAADCDPSYFSGIVSGRVNPSPRLRRRIARVLGRDEAELFDTEEVPA